MSSKMGKNKADQNLSRDMYYYEFVIVTFNIFLVRDGI